MAAYDSSIKKWHNLPVLRSFFSSKQSSISLASSRGLVCIALDIECSQPLVVWNPLTNASRDLPGMLIRHSMCVGMTVDHSTQELKIVVVGQAAADSSQMTEVYDSSLGSWTNMETSLSDQWYGCYSDALVYCKGAFYVLSANKNSPFRLCLVSFDLNEGLWKEKCKLTTTAGLSFASPSLFEVKPDHLFLAERTFPGHNQPYAIHLWELLQQSETRVEWIKVSVVPQGIIEELRREFWVSSYFKRLATGDLICFMGDNDFRGLVYDLSCDTWNWLPRRLERVFEHVVSYEPRLDMLNT